MTPTMATVIIAEAATTAAPTAIAIAEATMSIMATGKILMTGAAITDTTNTIGSNTNTGAIGARGTIGTVMPESIPASTNMDTITATMPI